MRKKQKDQIIELLNTMLDGGTELLQATSVEDKMALLEDCQEAAIQMGEAIEAAEGEGTQAVACLEKYCEELYLISQSFDAEDTLEQTANHITEMKKLLWATKKEIESFENTIEMVFFPYKASMWDSLESIWIAANEDPRCYAVVVPIPYVDRNPDGSVKEEHYEINLYPEEVPVVDYRDYNLDEEKPDVAFIHNPYDANNLVTSVHPDYYSYNLKPKVGKLVYVPYFALPGNLDKNYSDFSAYHHVDYIVTQTPEHRKSFPVNLPDEMFLPFGSPKFDAIIRKCKNPKPVPAEWKKRMEGKRVFFYNTSLRCAIGEPEDYLKKMGEVFKLFAGRDDVCLVWRPHPLLEATFDSMQPEYANVFRRLRELYISQGIGIYDDTPCMEDTISWCDAYLGDEGSSVVSSFAMAEKPIYILNNQMHGVLGEKAFRERYLKLIFDNYGDDRWIVTWGDELWHSENNDYCYKFVRKLEGASNETPSPSYCKAKEYNGKVYILPTNAQNVLVYEDGQIRKIELLKEIEGSGAFSGGEIFGETLWLWPLKYPALVRININTEQVTYDREIRDFHIALKKNNFVSGPRTYTEGNVLLGSAEGDRYVSIDTVNFEKRVLTFPGHDLSDIGVVCEERYAYEQSGNRYLWFFKRKGYEVYRYNTKTEEIRKYFVQPEDFHGRSVPNSLECDDLPFGGVIGICPGKVLLSPRFGNHYVVLELDSGENYIWEYSKYFESNEEDATSGGLGGVVANLRPELNKGLVRFTSTKLHGLIEFNMEKNSIKEIIPKFDLETRPFGFQQTETIYACVESGYNSLLEMIMEETKSYPFNPEYQHKKNMEINASTEGQCGDRIKQFFVNRYDR